MNIQPPRKGWGTLPYMYAYWVCAARETPIFSPKFPLRSISFSQMTQYSAPEHHHFTFLPFWRPSFSQFLYVQVILLRLQLAKTRPTVSSGDPQFHARARSGAPHFHARARPTHFSLCRSTCLPTFGASTPPPPPPPPPGIQQWNFKCHTCMYLWYINNHVLNFHIICSSLLLRYHTCTL